MAYFTDSTRKRVRRTFSEQMTHVWTWSYFKRTMKKIVLSSYMKYRLFFSQTMQVFANSHNKQCVFLRDSIDKFIELKLLPISIRPPHIQIRKLISKLSPPQIFILSSYDPISKKYWRSIENKPPAIAGDWNGRATSEFLFISSMEFIRYHL